ncbi:unnamed protein product [Pedinophyceae sp. YPF-701]|nr:unnamed protein product [Pedinophyceae sp. YPF-701]
MNACGVAMRVTAGVSSLVVAQGSRCRPQAVAGIVRPLAVDCAPLRQTASCRVTALPATPLRLPPCVFGPAGASTEAQARPSARCFASKQKELPPGVIKEIDKDDLTVQFARSSGAGGQNVNKVNTKADVRLNLAAAWFLTEEVKDAIRTREKNRVNNNDELVVQSQEHRTQHQNLATAIEKVNEMVCQAAESLIVKEPTEEKKKRIKGLKKAYNQKRLDGKKKHGMKKKERRAKPDW